MKIWKSVVLCAAALAMLPLAGCAKTEETQESPADVQTGTQAQTEAQDEETQPPHSNGEGVHIHVDSVEITENALHAQNNTVQIAVTLEENAGITYAEWGIIMDPRCTFTKDEHNENVTIPVYESINDEEHFMWTAWTSGVQVSTDTGCMIVLNVQLPEIAAAGDVYTVKYANRSLADLPHVWSSDEHNWGDENAVTWDDGAITVTE